MDKLYVVIPAYNESQNIEQTVNDWYPIVERYNDSGNSRLVIIDDGSTDDTYQKLLMLSKKRELMIPLTKANGGHGSTVIFAYDYAIKNGAEWIFQTDSDGQTDPAEFDAFWNERENYDAIFGNRTARGDGRSRAFVEKVVCRIVKHYFGVKVPDANAPFRLMRTEKVKKYIYKLKPDFNLPNIMLTTYFVYYKERFMFKEITFKPRGKGKNSINIKKIVKIGWNALKDFRRLKKEL